jgi:RimJ/RimL family protein N-acetyltransferase
VVLDFFNNNYSILNQQKFSIARFSIVPIRYEDRYLIMKWRNEQMYHLRQNQLLTEQVQDLYFTNVIAKLFEQERPGQILFSFLKDDICIGYGGLVHINWVDLNAEISFLIATLLEKEYFEQYWTIYLSLIEEVAFVHLGLHKIFTYAYDLRPSLYSVLEQCGFQKDAVLKEHCCFGGKFIDVVIHAKLNPNLLFRKATINDVDLTYKWATDSIVRKYAFSKEFITPEVHAKWFAEKIKDPNTLYYLLFLDNQAIGSIRFDRSENEDAMISYLIDPEFHGKGFGRYILKHGIDLLLSNQWAVKTISGYVLKQNLASVKLFYQLGFEKVSEDISQLKFQKICQNVQ